jgi:hypothetical protein
LNEAQESQQDGSRNANVSICGQTADQDLQQHMQEQSRHSANGTDGHEATATGLRAGETTLIVELQPTLLAADAKAAQPLPSPAALMCEPCINALQGLPAAEARWCSMVCLAHESSDVTNAALLFM